MPIKNRASLWKLTLCHQNTCEVLKIFWHIFLLNHSKRIFWSHILIVSSFPELFLIKKRLLCYNGCLQPTKYPIVLLSKQTGAHSNMHGMQCNQANGLWKDLSSSEQREFKWCKLKPSILDEGFSSEGLWTEPRTCRFLWELWVLYTK